MIGIVLAFFALVLACYLFYGHFHRVPARKIPSEPGVVVSPADGTVWQIVPLDSGDPSASTEIRKQFLGKIKTLTGDVENAAAVVSIFMSPLDAHVNWFPLDGKVLSVKHTEGNFSLANSWKSLWNEKNEILIQADGFRLKVIQIAGFLARRIECWIKENDTLRRGTVFGIIRLGSQVSVVLPGCVELRVKTGQRVRGGETLLGVVKR